MKFRVTRSWDESRYSSIIVEAKDSDRAFEIVEAKENDGEVDWYPASEYGDGGDRNVELMIEEIGNASVAPDFIDEEDIDETGDVLTWPKNKE